MANTYPIVTEVTKVELDALVTANALEEGLQYKVTDKGWLLYATKVNELNSYSPIKIINGETLPIGVKPDLLIIDTGNINVDISVGANPIILHSIQGYLLYDVAVKATIDENGTGIGNINAVEFTLGENWIETNINPYIKLIRSIPIFQSDTQINCGQISAQGVDSNNTIRFLLEFNKSLF